MVSESVDDDTDYLFGSNIDNGVDLDVDVRKTVPDDEDSVDGNLKEERSAMPKWLKAEYADFRERIAREIKLKGKPMCYQQNTFFDGGGSPFFGSHRKFQPSPQDFYKPCFFVWIPHLLIGRIPCPSCYSAGRKNTKGELVLLQAYGWPKAPRRVVDVDRCIFIIGHRYACVHPQCKKTYQSWSPSLLAALPRSVSLHFNHHLTYRSGITDKLWSIMRESFLHCTGPEPFANMVRTHHVRRYEQLKLQYLELVYSRSRAAGRLLGKFQEFSSFDDPEGYAGFIPSSNYFRSIYVKTMAARGPTMDKHMSMLSASILEVDHSFKVSCLMESWFICTVSYYFPYRL